MAIFTSRGAHLNCAIMAMLYTHSIRNQPLNTMVVFKMRDSVHSPRYSAICNVLRQWKTSLIPTLKPKKHLKNEQISRDAAAKKRANTSIGVRRSRRIHRLTHNNYNKSHITYIKCICAHQGKVKHVIQKN